MFLVYVVFCFLFLVVITGAIDCLERLVSEMTCYVVFSSVYIYRSDQIAESGNQQLFSEDSILPAAIYPPMYMYLLPCISDSAFADIVHVYKFHLLTYLLFTSLITYLRPSALKLAAAGRACILLNICPKPVKRKSANPAEL